MIATTEVFQTRICCEFSDENGPPILVDVGACYFMGPEAAPGNPVDMCLFYTEGDSIVLALAGMDYLQYVRTKLQSLLQDETLETALWGELDKVLKDEYSGPRKRKA